MPHKFSGIEMLLNEISSGGPGMKTAKKSRRIQNKETRRRISAGG
jgi:hypothetical protein